MQVFRFTPLYPTWGIISTRRSCNYSQRKKTICCIQLQITDLGQPSSSRNSHTPKLRNQELPPRLQTARSSCFSIQGSAKMLKKRCPSGVLRAGQICATKMYNPVNKQFLGRTVQSWGKLQQYGSCGSQLLVLSNEIAIDTVLTLLYYLSRLLARIIAFYIAFYSVMAGFFTAHLMVYLAISGSGSVPPLLGQFGYFNYPNSKISKCAVCDKWLLLFYLFLQRLYNYNWQPQSVGKVQCNEVAMSSLQLHLPRTRTTITSVSVFRYGWNMHNSAYIHCDVVGLQKCCPTGS